MKVSKSCSKCGHTPDTNVVKCPQCGSWMPKAKGIRRRGWVLVFLGLLIVVMMGVVTVNLAPAMLSAGSAGARFTGTPEQAAMILGLFGLVLVFGITCTASGIWQIITGRRNIWIVILIVGLAVLLFVASVAVREALDGKGERGRLGNPDRRASRDVHGPTSILSQFRSKS